VNQSLSKKIKKFFCHLCRHKKPFLRIKYKSKFQEISKTFSKPGAHKYTGTDISFQKFYKEIQLRLKKEDELIAELEAKKVHSKPSGFKKSEPSGSSKKRERSPGKDQDASSLLKTHTGRSSVSGEDIENFVSAMTRINSETATSAAKSEPMAYMDHDYTIRKPGSNAGGGVKRSFRDLDDESSRASEFGTDQNGNSIKSSRLHSEISNSDEDTRDYSDGDTDAASNTGSESERDRKSSSPGKKLSSSKTSKSSNGKNQKSSSKSSKSAQDGRKKLKLSQGQKPQQQQPKKRLQRNSSSVTLSEHDEKAKYLESNAGKLKKEPVPVQCLGPECINAAVENSKYCSHECGVKLAKNRLTYYLQTRYETFNNSGPCLADQINMSELERIGVEIANMQAKLNELEQKHHELDEIIERAKFAKINPNVEVINILFYKRFQIFIEHFSTI
jgi:hypothetical protein